MSDFQGPSLPQQTSHYSPPESPDAATTTTDPVPSRGGGGPPRQAPTFATKKLPPSQFATGRQPPTIDIKPLEQPDSKVTIEYCLEQMARVLESLAENQEEPAWAETHRSLAEQWAAAAQMLLEHAQVGNAQLGDAQIKQHEIMMNEELHQQTLAHNDQKHFSTMRQEDDKHKVNLKHIQDQHEFDMKRKRDTATQQDKEHIAARKASQSGQG